MRNKKAIGLHWDIAILAFLISVGILMYYISSMHIPKIGEFSLKVIKSLENSNNIPITIKVIMKEIGKKTTDQFGSNRVFTLKSYCYNPLNIPPPYYSPVPVSIDSLPKPTTYRESLTGKTFSPPSWLSSKRRNVKCLVDTAELGNYYWEAFDKKYRNDFSPKRVKNLNLDFNYRYSVEKEDNKFFIKSITDNKLEVPIKFTEANREEQIGKAYFNPSSKILVNYSFDEVTIYSVYNPVSEIVEYSHIPSKEVCILSRDCGANCQNVTEWAKIAYTPPKYYKIKKNPCNMYYHCVEPADARDDFGNYYACKDSYPNGNRNYLCEGECLPYCSSLEQDYVTVTDTEDITAEEPNGRVVKVAKPGRSDETVVIDTDDNTECAEFSCDNYVSCAALSTTTCGCPIGYRNPISQILQTNACEGTGASPDCINLDCTKDTEYESAYSPTSCKERACDMYGLPCGDAISCSNLYGGCPSPNDKTCLCSSLLNPNACEGDCYCRCSNGQEAPCGADEGWVDETGKGCGDIATDETTDCSWNEKPQKREYDPTTCKDTEYRCDNRDISECPCTGNWVDESGKGCGDTTSDGLNDCSWNEKPQIKEYTENCEPTEYRCDAKSLDECACTVGSWTDTGGCGGTRGDYVTCNWNEKPQSRTYSPTACHSTEYRCDSRTSSECPCVPVTPCSSLGCGKTDSCGTYCGDCPSCNTNCGACRYPENCDYDGDGDASDGQRSCSGGKETLSGGVCVCGYGGCSVSCGNCQSI